MLTILFNQPGQSLPLLTGVYNVARPIKPTAQRQRIALRGTPTRMASGTIALGLGEPPDQPEGRQREEEEELVMLFAMMG